MTDLNASLFAVSITVNDLDRSLRFYQDALGFTFAQRFEDAQGVLQGGILEAGMARLNVSQDDFAKGRDRAKGVAMRFFLETAQDIGELATQVTLAGWAVHGPMALPWGPMALSVTDPDGFHWTIANSR